MKLGDFHFRTLEGTHYPYFATIMLRDYTGETNYKGEAFQSVKQPSRGQTHKVFLTQSSIYAITTVFHNTARGCAVAMRLLNDQLEITPICQTENGGYNHRCT